MFELAAYGKTIEERRRPRDIVEPPKRETIAPERVLAVRRAEDSMTRARNTVGYPFFD